MNIWLKEKRNETVFEYLFCYWEPLTEIRYLPSCPLSNTDFSKPLFQIALTWASLYLPAGSFFLCGSFLSINPLYSDGLQGSFWVLFSPHPTISPSAISPLPLMLTTPQIPISSTNLSPEPWTLRPTDYPPSTAGCPLRTPTNVSIADTSSARDPSPTLLLLLQLFA